MALSQLLHDMEAEHNSGYLHRNTLQTRRDSVPDMTPVDNALAANTKSRRLRSFARSKPSPTKSIPSHAKRHNSFKARLHAVSDSSTESMQVAKLDIDQTSQPLGMSRLQSASLAHLLVPPICFTADGSAFIIHDTKRLEAILPRYFGTNVYRSFHRQLNMYSFHSLTPLEKHHADLPTTSKVFRHEYFHRDADEATLAMIKRKQPRLENGDNVKWEEPAVKGSISPPPTLLSPVSMVDLPPTPKGHQLDVEASLPSHSQIAQVECPVWGIGPPAISWPIYGSFFEPRALGLYVPPPGSCRLSDVAPPPPEVINYWLSLSYRTPAYTPSVVHTSYFSPEQCWDDTSGLHHVSKAQPPL